MKKLNHHNCVDVAFGSCQINDSLVNNWEIWNSVEVTDGILFVFFGDDSLRAVVSDLFFSGVTSVGSVEEKLPLSANQCQWTDHINAISS